MCFRTGHVPVLLEVEFEGDDLDSDELFDTFPEIIFGSLRKQMLLGILPAQAVGTVLEPLLRNFHEIMPELSPDLRRDFENILRIYPDVAAQFGLRIRPPIGEALFSLVEFLSIAGKISEAGDPAGTGVELDLAAEEQNRFNITKRTPLKEGQGFLTTDGGNSVYLEFSWSRGDDFISFRRKPAEIEIDVHICGAYAFTLGPSVLEERLEKNRLLEIFTRQTVPADVIQLVEKQRP